MSELELATVKCRIRIKWYASLC